MYHRTPDIYIYIYAISQSLCSWRLIVVIYIYVRLGLRTWRVQCTRSGQRTLNSIQLPSYAERRVCVCVVWRRACIYCVGSENLIIYPPAESTISSHVRSSANVSRWRRDEPADITRPYPRRLLLTRSDLLERYSRGGP